MKSYPPFATVGCILLACCSAGGEAQQGGQSAIPEGAVPGEGGYATIVEAPPYPPIVRLGPAPYEASQSEKRALFAARTEERHLPLLRRIKRDEMGNFGGIEWRWRDGPDNGGLGRLSGVAYFLRAPQGTLARFTTDPLFVAARADFSRSDQDRVARQWSERIGPDLASPGFGNMSVPWLDILLPRSEFERRAKAAGWNLPVNLQLRFHPGASPERPAVPLDVAPLIRAFPQLKRLSGPVPDIATYDAMVLRDGCFFIDEAGDDDPLAEFPLDIGVHRDAEGYLAFRSRYRNDARRLGRVGTRLQLGYRSAPREAPPELRSACGATEIVEVTSADQAAGYGPLWFAVKEYRDREGLTSKEAMRRANACVLEQERAMADNRLRGTRKHATQCAKLGLMGGPVAPPPPVPVPPAAPGRSTEQAESPPPPPKRMVPSRNGVCRFEERDPAERPRGLIQTNFRSNMIFWADRGAVLWDHPNGHIDEGMVIPGKRIVAQRQGMKDLWISPARDGDIMLYSGPGIFECRMRTL